MLDKVLLNIRDMRYFGPAIVSRHFARLRRDRVATIPVRGVGQVSIRIDESDLAAIRQVFCGGEYDVGGALGAMIEDRYHAMVAEGHTPIIVDAGANIGAASLWFGQKFPAAHIVAVEPDPGNAALLRANLLPNGKCVILEAAIGATTGFVSFNTTGSGWAVQTKRADAGVRIVTVADAFASSQGDTPFLVKIDIEGFEADLFSANTDWIEQCHVVVIEPHDWMLPGKKSSHNFQKVMASFGYDIAIKGENLFYVRTEL